MPSIVVVNPTSGSPVPAAGLRVALGSLSGASVGFFSNGKPNADVVLLRVEELLCQRFGIAPRRYCKPAPSLGAEPALLDEIRRDCQAVVVAGFD